MTWDILNFVDGHSMFFSPFPIYKSWFPILKFIPVKEDVNIMAILREISTWHAFSRKCVSSWRQVCPMKPPVVDTAWNLMPSPPTSIVGYWWLPMDSLPSCNSNWSPELNTNFFPICVPSNFYIEFQINLTA